MKLKLTIASAFLALAVSSNAANYLITNVATGDGSADALFQNYNGTLSTGIVALGYFPAGYVFTTGVAAATNFTTLGSALAGSYSATLDASKAGYVEATVSGSSITAGNALLGRDLYVFAGNASTIALSNQYAVAKVGTIADDVPFVQDYVANPFGATPVIGTIGSYTGDASGLGSSTYTTLQLAGVPETSTALLGAIGALGLLRRRRN